MIAADLPELMSAPCVRGPFRVPLAQFVMDWNRSTDRGGLIADAPVHADDGNVLPAIAVVVHALAVRDRERVPDWVHDHRAEGDVALFGHALDTPFGRWVRDNAPRECTYHKVFFHAGFLDKGTDRQWLPRV